MRPSLVIIALACVVSCTREPEQKTYQLHGQILAVNHETREVLVKHEDIPGFMPAMTMPYVVKDVRVIEGRTAGDLITATLMVSEGHAWLSTIAKTGAAPLPQDAPTRIPVATNVHILEPGDVVPDTMLTDQDGAAISLTSWRGSFVVVTFIYTRCPLPEFCPLMDKRFAELQGLLDRHAALRGQVRLLSVSFDPDRDTPTALKAQATRLKADANVWRLATAPPEIVDRFAATFGVNVIREKDGTITHNLRTAVIDRGGKVVRVIDGNQWTAREVIADLEQGATR